MKLPQHPIIDMSSKSEGESPCQQSLFATLLHGVNDDILKR